MITTNKLFLNGDHLPDLEHAINASDQLQSNNQLVAKVQYFYDLLQRNVNYFEEELKEPKEYYDCIDTAITVYEELFSDFLYKED